MLVTVSGILILVSSEHPSKAEEPMLVNPSGRVIESRALQFLKVLLSIASSPLGQMMLFSCEQP